MMQDWFLDGKLGIFVHWGIYAVKGIPESWAFYLEQISYPEYMKQLGGFTASRYDPDAWADLFNRAGARYAVLTTKHHDGVALWDTKLSDLNVIQKTPAGRDLIRPYVEAMRRAGLRVGFYFSHLDWSHPDYALCAPGCTQSTCTPDAHNAWIEGEGAQRWENFLRFQRGQIEELCTSFGPIDLLWFDGDWQPAAPYWRMEELRAQIERWQPQAVLNSRVCGRGDYATPEQSQPVVRPEGMWEYCVTVNNSWGYQRYDTHHKSPARIIRLFAETIGWGGNLLLDVGPYEDGTFQPEQVSRLEILGDWTRKHAEAIYGTVGGLPPEHHYGPSTLSKDGKTLYAMVFDRPRDAISIKGIFNRVRRVSVLGPDATLAWVRDSGWEPERPNVLRIDLPDSLLDPYVTVLKIELEGPLSLYRGAGRD